MAQKVLWVNSVPTLASQSYLNDVHCDWVGCFVPISVSILGRASLGGKAVKLRTFNGCSEGWGGLKEVTWVYIWFALDGGRKGFFKVKHSRVGA